ncbi:T9SS type A sorting domain-containing protein [Salibacter halophilus]|nr:T9SS type A sorting domain-containing protein [Salibacter halophilus]
MYSGTNDIEVWISPTDTSGTPNITAPGWTQIMSPQPVVTATTGDVDTAYFNSPYLLQPGTYGVWIGSASNTAIRYHNNTAALPSSFTDGIVTIETGTGIGFGGGLPTPSFSDRELVGGLIYQPAGDDAGIAEILSPSAPDCSNDNLYVQLVNDGGDTLTSADIDWSVDGIQQNTIVWNGQLAPFGGTSDSIFIGDVSSLNQGEELKVWASNPNGSQDQLPGNDTMRFVRPSYGDLDIPGQFVLCQGERDTINTGLSFSDHMWSDGSSKTFLEIETAGQYSVTTEDISTGCIQVADFNVIEETPVNLADSVNGCTVDGGTTVSGNVQGSYQWSTGASTSFLNITETGSYWVQVTDPTGKCVSSDTVYATIYDDPEAGFTGEVNFVTVSFTDTSNNGTDILWEFGDGSSSSNENPIHVYPGEEGTYTVTQVVSNICGSDSITQTFTVSPDQVNSVGNLKEINDLKVYPNPASSQVNIALDLTERMNVSIEITDMQGRVVMMENLGDVNGKQVYNFNASDLSSGVYILNIQNRKGSIGHHTLIVE